MSVLYHVLNCILPCVYVCALIFNVCHLLLTLQYIEEESESSVFDCRFSPDGLTFAATDALGHVILFGFGDKWTYRKVTKNFKVAVKVCIYLVFTVYLSYIYNN